MLVMTLLNDGRHTHLLPCQCALRIVRHFSLFYLMAQTRNMPLLQETSDSEPDVRDVPAQQSHRPTTSQGVDLLNSYKIIQKLLKNLLQNDWVFLICINDFVDVRQVLIYILVGSTLAWMMTQVTVTHKVALMAHFLFSNSLGTSVATHRRAVWPPSPSPKSTSTAPPAHSSGCFAHTRVAARASSAVTLIRTPAPARTGASCAPWAAARS